MDNVVEVPTATGVPATSVPASAGPAAVASGSSSTPPTDDLMKQYGLDDVLSEMRGRKLRSSFIHYIPELPTDKVPLKPRCPAGSLVSIAQRPVGEDNRRLEEFEERVIRAALTFKEVPGEKIAMPDWLDEEQAWGDEASKRKKRREKKKKKKKKKRKRGDDDDAKADDDEKRMRKKRK